MTAERPPRPRPSPRGLLALLALAALALGPDAVRAQRPDPVQDVRGNVIEGDSNKPLEGAMVLLFNEAGRRVNGVLSATNGFYRILVPAPGRYHLRVDRIGYASTDTEFFDVAAGATVERRVVTAVKPIQLAQIDVSGGRRCEVRPAEGVATATVWEEARKALAAATWTSEREMYQFAWMRYQRSVDESGLRILSEQRTFNRHFTSQPFSAVEPSKLASTGFVEMMASGDWQYYAPDAKVLLSDDFLDTHCLRLQREERDGTRMMGLAFEPISGRRLPDVQGVLWLDQESAQLRSLEYRYVNLLRDLREHDGGGELTYALLPNGTWIVKEWRIRMPRIAEERDGQGRTRRFVVTGYRDEGGVVQQATTAAGGVVLDDLQGGVHGIVTDSLGRPAAGRSVAIEGTRFATVSDADGSFSFSGVGRGIWRVVVADPVLEAAGEPGAHADVIVQQTGVVEARVEIPSGTWVILQRCVETPPASDEAVLSGRVLDSAGSPVPNAEVRVTWNTVTTAIGLRMREEGLAMVSDESGVYTFCAVPTDRTVSVRAVLGERESEAVAIPIAIAQETVVAQIVLPDGTGR